MPNGKYKRAMDKSCPVIKTSNYKISKNKKLVNTKESNCSELIIKRRLIW